MPEHHEPSPVEGFEKFTKKAAAVLDLARGEARRLGHGYVGTGHLLLGIIRQDNSLAARALVRMGVDLDGIRSAVESTIGRGDRTTHDEMGLNPEAKAALEMAAFAVIEPLMREIQRTAVTQPDRACELSEREQLLRSDHLLLGLLHLRESIATQVLDSMGVTADKVRAEAAQILDESNPDP